MPVVIQLTNTDTQRLRRGRDYIWNVIRDLSADDTEFSHYDVVGLCDPGQQTAVSNMLKELCLGGYATRNEDLKKPTYRLVKRPPRRPVLDANGKEKTGGLAGKRRQAMWNVMRRNRYGWTVQELAVAASTDDVSVTIQSAHKYVHALHKADLLTKLKPTGHARLVYRLKGTANTGPKPPIVVTGSGVYDQNTNKLVGDLFMKGDAS